jgi:hypothetical protein
MQPFIVLSRQAATQSMISQGKSRSDSFDFLPDNHPRIFNSPKDLPITFKIQQSAPSHPIMQHEIINLQNLLSHVKSPNQNNDDSTSTISHQTKVLHIQPPHSITTLTPKCQCVVSACSIFTTDHQHLLTTTTLLYIKIKIPITTTAQDILTHIFTNNTSNSIQPQNITKDIPSDLPQSSPTNHTEQNNLRS